MPHPRFLPVLLSLALAPLGAQSGYEDRTEWWSRAPDGCTNYVAEFGTGVPLVVLHGGWGAEHSYMVGAVEQFAAS